MPSTWIFQPFEFSPGRWVLSIVDQNSHWPCAPEGHPGFPSAKKAARDLDSLRFAEELTGLPIVELFSNNLEFEEIS
ncbi:MAG: hypothetical protein ACRC62_33065 [Microcoleus sp.]